VQKLEALGIAVVDDEPAILDVFRGVLARSGYHVACFVDCIASLDSFMPDGRQSWLQCSSM
jgi:CheY-like chemotaxis protein